MKASDFEKGTITVIGNVNTPSLREFLVAHLLAQGLSAVDYQERNEGIDSAPALPAEMTAWDRIERNNKIYLRMAREHNLSLVFILSSYPGHGPVTSPSDLHAFGGLDKIAHKIIF